MELRDELLDELLKDYQKPEDIVGENGLLKQLTKELVERALKSELPHHLGYGRNEDGLESAERVEPEDAERRLRRVRNRGAEGPGEHLRAATADR